MQAISTKKVESFSNRYFNEQKRAKKAREQERERDEIAAMLIYGISSAGYTHTHIKQIPKHDAKKAASLAILK